MAGELHRRQAAIAERVIEQLPDHASPEKLALELPGGTLVIDWESLHANFRAENGDTHTPSIARKL